MKTLTMSRTGFRWALPVYLAAILGCGAVPVRAATIAVTYSLAGAVSSVPVSTATTLSFDSLSTLSVLSGNPSWNAIWNPVNSLDHNVIDFTTGLNHATFTWTFADGSTLLGTLLENVSQVDGAGVGPFTQTFTFTGGTKEFAGATGSVAGPGIGTSTGFTSSGSGMINAPAIPEPASGALLLGGSALLFLARRRLQQQRTHGELIQVPGRLFNSVAIRPKLPHIFRIDGCFPTFVEFARQIRPFR